MKSTIRSTIESTPILFILREFLGALYWVSRCKLMQIFYRKNAYHLKCDRDWSRINFNRIAVVNFLLAKKSAGRYLEIGCATNLLFNSVPTTNKVGVDPVAGGTHRRTSDAFFAENKEEFDVIFIDGLHTFEQVYRDIENALKVLRPDGYIAIHDMLPNNWIEHHVPNISPRIWTGDVWKVAFDLLKASNIDFKIVAIDLGVGIVRKTSENYSLPRMSEELTGQGFSYFYQNQGKLPIIDWDEFTQWAK